MVSLNERILNRIPERITARYGIVLLIVFGSCADGRTHQNSDLDLGYLSRELLDRETETELIAELMQFYQKSEIDLVDLKKASPALKLEAASKGSLVFGSERDLLNFQLYAAARYADTSYLRRERENYLRERMKKL